MLKIIHEHCMVRLCKASTAHFHKLRCNQSIDSCSCQRGPLAGQELKLIQAIRNPFKSSVLKLFVVLMNKLCDVEFIAVLFHCKATNGIELFNKIVFCVYFFLNHLSLM